MNLAHPIRSVKQLTNATIFIVFLALCTGASAQNVYKCGNSYSQTPCPGAQTINVDDARTAAQKKQTEAAVRWDAKEAQSLEKTRMAQEKAALQQRPAVAPSSDTATTPMDTADVVHKITPKRIKPRHYKPQAFVAEVSGSEPKKIVKKKAKTKTVQKTASSPA